MSQSIHFSGSKKKIYSNHYLILKFPRRSMCCRTKKLKSSFAAEKKIVQNTLFWGESHSINGNSLSFPSMKDIFEPNFKPHYLNLRTVNSIKVIEFVLWTWCEGKLTIFFFIQLTIRTNEFRLSKVKSKEFD